MYDKSSVFIIAEAGVNHNGSLEMAMQLVDAASTSGADAVKFQTFKAEDLVSKYAEKADYQKKTTATSEGQLAMLKKLELSKYDHKKLIEHANKAGIKFMSSPFDHKSLNLLASDFDLPLLKLGSGELTNSPLLLAIAQTGKPLILSTGMSTLLEVEEALSVLSFGYLNKSSIPSLNDFKQSFHSSEGQKILQDKVSLLHCTTEYPAPYEEVNLQAMDTLTQTFGLTIGYSDHTQGWAIPLAAVARGARIIEKHFTISRDLPGPDHKASIEVHELLEMVKAIRQIEQSFGDGNKQPTPSEIKNMKVARKSLIAQKSIRQGEPFTKENLTVKRPGVGISPIQYWDYLGQLAKCKYSKDEII